MIQNVQEESTYPFLSTNAGKYIQIFRKPPTVMKAMI